MKIKIKYKIILLILICFLGLILNSKTALAYEIKIIKGNNPINAGKQIKVSIDTVDTKDVSYEYSWTTNNSKVIKIDPVTEKKEVITGTGVNKIKQIKEFPTKEATITGLRDGNATVKCTVTANLPNGKKNTFNESIKVTVGTATKTSGGTNGEFKDVLGDIENYIPKDETSDGRLEAKVSIILTIITNIGMILAVLMCAIIGVKYMLGSLEEKAEYKKDMIPYLVGACLLFGITVIVKVLQQLGQSINNI